VNNLRVVTTREDFQHLVASLDSPARVPVEVRTTVADPYDAYRRVRQKPAPDEEGCDEDGRDEEGCDGAGWVYLETTGGQDG